MDFQQRKFMEMVHYICSKADHEDLGSIKLNKILWLSDFVHYMLYGQPITGEVYIKRQYGPVPHHIMPVLEELQKHQRIVVRPIAKFGYESYEYITLGQTDLSLFSAQEISLIDEHIGFICKEHTARSISEFSHNRIWELAEIGEEIPYEAAFAIKPGEVTEEDIQWAKRNVPGMA